MKKERLNVRFTQKESKTIKDLAEITGMSKSEVVRTMFNFTNYVLQSKILDKALDKFDERRKKIF